MIATFVRFRLGERFDAARLQQIASAARGKFEGLPGLRSKTFTLDVVAREAVNVYVWDSEDAARAFFTDAAIDGVAKVYGVRPEITIAAVAELVDNGAA